MIKLGTKVKCKITGFVGTVVARTEFINGCVQCSVLPKTTKKDKFPEDMGIDEGSLEPIEKKKKVIKKKRTGGPSRIGMKMKGY